MADNVNITPGSGEVIAADEITDATLGTCKVQYVKVIDGTIGGTSKQIITNGAALVYGALQPDHSGKTVVMKTGSLVTTATTADQVILTYTVTAGKTFYMEYLSRDCRLTTFATTATFFGAASLESPAGTKLITRQIAGAGIFADPGTYFGEPIPLAAGTVIRVVCTPNAATSYTWQASFGGYEK